MNRGKERENYWTEVGKNKMQPFDLSQNAATKILLNKTSSDNNEIIFSDEQREYIIGKFPDTIQDF